MILPHLADLAVAMAPAPEGAEAEGHGYVLMIFYIGFFLILYYFIIRPQTRQVKEQEKLQSSVEKGDRVVTKGGIFGTIHKVDGEVVTLEVAEGVRIKVTRDSIQERVRTADGKAAEKDGK